ncbi:sulfatase-like hydrolase/transferase [Candidatus Gottesmanbacteria bacterium]|nr:sulfatase-like hydrolase/transferase [Candidatus Gottesmanbacteria bacterium]
MSPEKIRRSKAAHLYSIFIATLFFLLGISLLAASRRPLIRYLTGTLTGRNETLCKNCNVVVISLDTLSARHLPCYGYAKNTMPNLCAFARKNIWFTNSYSQSFFTLPSHFSLFTSLYPSTHGVLETLVDSLDQRNLTLTQVLQKHGYNTLYFGPTKNEEIPLDKGFERGFDYIDPNYEYDRRYAMQNWTKGIEMLKENQRQGKPTFLFLHSYYVHEPYLPMTRSLHFTKENIPNIPVTTEEYYKATPELISFIQKYFKQNPLKRTLEPTLQAAYQAFLANNNYEATAKLYAQLAQNDCSDFCWPIDIYYYRNNKQNPQYVAYIEALYDELAWQLDERLTTFLSSLQPLLQENTILILTADHGEGFMEHGELFHTTLYNEILRVPLVMSIPNLRAKIIRNPVESIDIYPTILDILGFQPESPVEGANLTGVILGLPLSRGKQYIISELYNTVPDIQKQKTIIDSRWKLLVKNIDDLSNPQNIELYNTQKDPGDRINVASRYPSVVKRMLEQVQQFMVNHYVTFPNLLPKTPEIIQEEIQKQQYFHY